MTARLCDVACLICDRLGMASVPRDGIHRADAAIALPHGWSNAERLPSFAPVCSAKCLDTWRAALSCSL